MWFILDRTVSVHPAEPKREVSDENTIHFRQKAKEVRDV